MSEIQILKKKLETMLQREKAMTLAKNNNLVKMAYRALSSTSRDRIKDYIAQVEDAVLNYNMEQQQKQQKKKVNKEAHELVTEDGETTKFKQKYKTYTSEYNRKILGTLEMAQMYNKLTDKKALKEDPIGLDANMINKSLDKFKKSELFADGRRYDVSVLVDNSHYTIYERYMTKDELNNLDASKIYNELDRTYGYSVVYSVSIRRI